MYLSSVYFQSCVFSTIFHLDNFILKVLTSFNSSVTYVLGNQINTNLENIKFKFSDFGLLNNPVLMGL